MVGDAPRSGKPQAEPHGGAAAGSNVTFTLCDQRGSTLTSQIGYQYRLDRRDDPVRPTRGFYFNFAQDLAGLGGNVKFLRTTIDTVWYHGFLPGLVLSAGIQAGDVEPWGGDYVRINDRSYRGQRRSHFSYRVDEEAPPPKPAFSSTSA